MKSWPILGSNVTANASVRSSGILPFSSLPSIIAIEFMIALYNAFSWQNFSVVSTNQSLFSSSSTIRLEIVDLHASKSSSEILLSESISSVSVEGNAPLTGVKAAQSHCAH